MKRPVSTSRHSSCCRSRSRNLSEDENHDVVDRLLSPGTGEQSAHREDDGEGRGHTEGKQHTQKNIPLEFAILPPTIPAPRMWMTGTNDPRIEKRRTMM